MEHFLFEQVTDMDKNIDVLTKAKAECLYKQYFDDCEGPCSECLKYKKLQACYEKLSICDQLRMDSLSNNIVAPEIRARIRQEKDNRSGKIIRIVLITIFIILGVCFFIVPAKAQSYNRDFNIYDYWTYKPVKDLTPAEKLTNDILFVLEYTYNHPQMISKELFELDSIRGGGMLFVMNTIKMLFIQ